LSEIEDEYWAEPQEEISQISGALLSDTIRTLALTNR
jgi:hypothetical protein